MITSDVGIRVAVVAVAIALAALRLRWAPAAASGHWATRALLAGPVIAALCGGLLGWSAPGWVAEPFGHVLQPGLVFFAGWVGLGAGCGLDLRVVRRAAAIDFAVELASACAAVAVIFVLAYLVKRAAPDAAEFGSPVLILLAALCVAGPALPAGEEALRRGAGRGGFWTPSAMAALAALLAAVGTGLAPGGPFHITLPGSTQAWSLEVETLTGRLLWGATAGCIAGLITDLATKDDFTPGGLYPQMAAVTLLTAGVAGTIGLEPLWVGVVTGFWLVNATLRRLDILHVLSRSAVLPRLGIPLLAGWLVGNSCRSGAFDPTVFLTVLAVVLCLRPVLRIAAAAIERHAAHLGHRRRPPPPRPDLIAIDEYGIVLAAILTRVMEPAAGAGALAAALAGVLVLGGAAGWWEQRQDRS